MYKALAVAERKERKKTGPEKILLQMSKEMEVTGIRNLFCRIVFEVVDFTADAFVAATAAAAAGVAVVVVVGGGVV